MAEMIVPDKGGKGGKKRAKKQSTRVDLTAMVDMAFLLLTFFILATTFNKPKAMEVNKPAKEDDAKKEDLPAIKQSKTYTIMMGKNDMVYCYTGSDDDPNVKVDSTFFSRSGLRSLIKDRQRAVAQRWGNQDELFILIKPLPDSKYRNMVDVLDEMAITGVKRYAIIDEFNEIDDLIIKQSGNRKPDAVKTANVVVPSSK
jgi:biopolymer transport protein ExbD